MAPGAATSGAVIGGERRGRRGVVSAQVENALDGGEDGARKGRAAAAKANDLTSNTVFLIREGVEAEGGGE